jgi:alkylation response protein AidB-like acyl-CoA dehydrogenase
MALLLSEDERLLVDSTRGLLARSSPVSAFRALRDSGDPARYDPALWAELAAMGLIAPHVPEEDGGLGMGCAAAGLIAQEAGRTLCTAPLLSSALAAELIRLAGSGEQKAALIPAILDGSQLYAFAFDEAARHDPGRQALSAVAEGNGYRLDGAKRFVLDGGIAAGLIVAAATADGPRLFRVDADAPGVTRKALDLIDCRNASDIAFDGVRVEGDAALGDSAAARAAIARALDLGRVLLAAELLGLAQEAFGRTVAYLNERVQFGRRIGSFQALQHRAARQHIALELATGVVLKALRAMDEADPSAPALASLAKAVTTRTARQVMNEALQMHGGVGVTDDFDIGFFFKRARVAGETFGDDYFHKERLAELAWNI